MGNDKNLEQIGEKIRKKLGKKLRKKLGKNLKNEKMEQTNDWNKKSFDASPLIVNLSQNTQKLHLDKSNEQRTQLIDQHHVENQVNASYKMNIKFTAALPQVNIINKHYHHA